MLIVGCGFACLTGILTLVAPLPWVAPPFPPWVGLGSPGAPRPGVVGSPVGAPASWVGVALVAPFPCLPAGVPLWGSPVGGLAFPPPLGVASVLPPGPRGVGRQPV